MIAASTTARSTRTSSPPPGAPAPERRAAGRGREQLKKKCRDAAHDVGMEWAADRATAHERRLLERTAGTTPTWYELTARYRTLRAWCSTGGLPPGVNREVRHLLLANPHLADEFAAGFHAGALAALPRPMGVRASLGGSDA